MLKNFVIDTSRDRLYPDLACYQMNIAEMASRAVEDGADEDLLPSWSKFAADPLKGKGFFTYMLQALFDGKHDALELDVEYQVGEIADRRVAMMFIASANNDNLMKTAQIADRALPGYTVVTLCGHKDNRINGQRVTNRNSQQLVKEVLEQSEANILILSNQMAARSFSIPEITELYLAYDNGDNGATIQKMSRTLTPSKSDSKVGRVFSLSFDPNRDDKFDSMIMEAALKVKKSDEDIVSAMRRVLRSIDIFRSTEDGAELFDEAEFIKQSMARNGLSRVMGKVADISAIPLEVATALSTGNIDVARMTKVMASAKGKTHSASDADPKKKNKRDLSHEKMMAKVREMITTIVENMDILIYGTGETNVQSAFASIEENNLQVAVEERFGVEWDVIKFVFNTGIIKQEWIDIRMQVA
jgi:hypothetical protein